LQCIAIATFSSLTNIFVLFAAGIPLVDARMLSIVPKWDHQHDDELLRITTINYSITNNMDPLAGGIRDWYGMVWYGMVW